MPLGDPNTRSRLQIRVDDPRRVEAVRLLREHLDDMALHSPPESRHALDVDALRVATITFWTAWQGDELVGCGALSTYAPGHGEIKSMRTAAGHRRKGVAARLLETIIGEAKRRSYTRLSLETGSMAAFAPAHALYQRFGFAFCGPFGDYTLDPNSVFMTLQLSAAEDRA